MTAAEDSSGMIPEQIWDLSAPSGASGCASRPVAASPCPLQPGQQVTITYTGTLAASATTITYAGSLAASATSLTMHWGYNNWTGITDTAMTKQGNGTWTATITVPQGATTLNMAFHNQSNTWDNNNSSNYNLTVITCSSGAVSASPCPASAGQQVTITYAGSLAAGATSLTMHWGYNNWNSITDAAMTKQSNGSWTVTITLPQGATSLNMAFYNQSNVWDNNNASNYNLNP